jgi:hypothetical protein
LKKKFEKKFEKKFKKKFEKKFKKITNCRRGGEGGWRIVIPMPEAINFVDGRRQKCITFELSRALGTAIRPTSC